MAEPTDIGTIHPVSIIEEMQKSYLDYAMSVIVSRALPDARDGLKPVQRRIVFAMHQMGLAHTARYSKSAKVVGEVLGKYHPHGDMPVYEAMVRMAQNFSLRYPLIDGQGNFGSVDGDSAAAMRYCVTGDTLVVTEHGLRAIRDIGDLENIHLSILSKDRKVHTASKWFNCGIHPTTRVTTRKGYTLQGTNNHPILTLTKNKASGRPLFAWRLLEQIVPGDIVVIDRTADLLWHDEEVQLQAYIPILKNRVQRKVLPKTLNEDLSCIIGALLAEGTLKLNELEFCNGDAKWMTAFKQCWQRVFSDCRLHEFERRPSSYGKKSYFTFEIHSRYVIEFLRNIGLAPVKSAQRQIPALILSSPKHVLASFLRWYFEGDGSISSSKKMVELSCISTSEILIHQIQTALLRFGIVSAKRYDTHRNTHKLYIRGLRNYQLFADQIGFFSEHKTSKLHTVIENSSRDSTLSDYVPFISNYIRSHLSQTSPYTNVREVALKHNFDRYPNMAAIYSKTLPAMEPELRDDAELLFQNFLATHYVFDPIEEVAPASMENVYSLKVDSDCHSFVANGFVNHNTETRLSPIADELLTDINKETVNFTPNFDGSLNEPVVLPATLPNLLCNGASGIAVGMATNIPPHNGRELIDGLLLLIEHRVRESTTFTSTTTTEDLTKIIKGPDFPTGGLIYDQTEITAAYATGRGRILMRAKTEIEEGKSGKVSIIVTELPYQINKALLIARIAELVREKKLEGISDLRDESDRRGMRMVIELKRDANPQSVLNNLYRHTAMQSVFNVNMVALIEGAPQLTTLKLLLETFIRHRLVIITKRSEYDLAQARARAHILEGLKIALDHLDAVIETIRRSSDAEAARTNLMEKFKLTEIQATAILDMQLRRLAALERQKIEDEYAQVTDTIAHLENLLAHPDKMFGVIESELRQLKETYGDDRRTRVYKGQVGEFSEEDLIANEPTIITITRSGYVKRQGRDSFRMQHRGGKGVTGMTTKGEDGVLHIISAATHDNILFFTDRGRVFQVKAYEIPEGARAAKGQAVINLIAIDQGEKITSLLPIPKSMDKTHAVMVTKKGTVKKTHLSQYATIRRNGMLAIKLENGDELRWTRRTTGSNDLILVTRRGQSIRFPEKDIRATARDTIGVRGIKLRPQDEVISMEVIDNDTADLLVIMEKGLGKRTQVKEWTKQGRGGQGIKAAQITQRTGEIVSARLIRESDEQLILTSNRGHVIKLLLSSVPRLKRQTQGVILMRLSASDRIAAAACLGKEEDISVSENI